MDSKRGLLPPHHLGGKMRRMGEMAAPCSSTLVVMAWIIIRCCYYAANCNAQCTGSYGASCEGEALQAAATLAASCADEYGYYLHTTLDLAEHIVNDNGVLSCSSGGGGFSQTCSSILLLGSNQLSASCLDASATPQSASLDLDSCIQNNNGALQWACL